MFCDLEATPVLSLVFVEYSMLYWVITDSNKYLNSL